MFTDAEKRIVDLMYKGFKQKEIADKLFIARTTVQTHTNNIFRKLKVHNINQFLALRILELETEIEFKGENNEGN